MPKIKKTEADHIQITRDALVKAELEFVAFDGWNLQRAIKNANVDKGLALVACPRGASDLARWYHIMGDRAMVEVLGAKRDSNAVPVGVRAGVVFAVKTRLSISAPLNLSDRAIVRRNMAMFSLPKYAGMGGQLVWQTADKIWQGLGDESEDINWYTKRATLTAVYSATVLFWLGDDSADCVDSWDFLDRRIENIMQFERFKSGVKDTVIGQGIGRLFRDVKKPDDGWAAGFPNHHG